MMEMDQNHLPEPVRRSLLDDTKVEVSHWVRDAIKGATKIVALHYEQTLAKKLIQHAYQSASEQELPKKYHCVCLLSKIT